MAQWLSWWTVTEARKRADVLMDERNQIYEELKTKPAEFKREFGDAILPAHLVVGRSNTGASQLRWRLRGVKGHGQSFVTLGTNKSLALIAGAQENFRIRLLDYERQCYWLNVALVIREKEIRSLNNYLAILDMMRQQKTQTPK
jgi:GTPase